MCIRCGGGNSERAAAGGRPECSPRNVPAWTNDRGAQVAMRNDRTDRLGDRSRKKGSNAELDFGQSLKDCEETGASLLARLLLNRTADFHFGSSITVWRNAGLVLSPQALCLKDIEKKQFQEQQFADVRKRDIVQILGCRVLRNCSDFCTRAFSPPVISAFKIDIIAHTFPSFCAGMKDIQDVSVGGDRMPSAWLTSDHPTETSQGRTNRTESHHLTRP